MPKFMPTEEEREETVGIAGSLGKGRKLEGLTIVFSVEANR